MKYSNEKRSAVSSRFWQLKYSRHGMEDLELACSHTLESQCTPGKERDCLRFPSKHVHVNCLSHNKPFSLSYIDILYSHVLATWIEHPPSVWEVIGSIPNPPFGDSDFFFVPC